MSLTVIQLLPALNAGGVERGTLEVAQALVEAGHRALVVSAGGRLVAPLEALGAEHISLPIGRKSPFSLRYVSRLHTLFMQSGADVVHARSRLPAWLAWRALGRMAATGRPRFITTVHGLYSVNRYSAIMTRGERVICVSHAAREYVREHYPGVDDTRLVVIPRGVDRTRYAHGYQPPAAWREAWRRNHPEWAQRRILTLAGRVNRRKGCHTLIELIAALRSRRLDVQGLIVGDAPGNRRRYPAQLSRRAAELGVADHFCLLGPRDDLREIFSHSDLALSLSEKPEAFGRTVTEALSLGTPVLGWDHGGAGEQLRAVYPHGAVPTGDSQALADRAEALLQDPPPVPRDHPYTLERMLRRTLALYREAVGS